MKGAFDNQAFYAALDAARLGRRLTWKQVAAETGVSASTLTRMAQGKRPDVDGLAALTDWSGLRVEQFTKGTEALAEPLAQMTAILHMDRRLSAQGKTTLENVLRATYESLRSDPPVSSGN